VHRIGARQRHRHQGMAHLVMGDHGAFVRVEETVLLLESGQTATVRVLLI
jgi:hypothetical protein